jgi:hypothetical protein
MALLSMHRRLPIGSSVVLKGRGVGQPRPNFLLLFTRGVEVACPETQAMGSALLPLHCTNWQCPEGLLPRNAGEEPEIELALV